MRRDSHNQAGYDADGENDPTRRTVGHRIHAAGERLRRNRSLRCLPACLRNLPASSSAVDNTAIHVELGPLTAPMRTGHSTHRPRTPTEYTSRSAPSAPSRADSSSGACVGLGLGLPLDLQMTMRDTPTVSTATTVVAANHSSYSTSDMERSDSNESLLTYSILPPGLSSPIPSYADFEPRVNRMALPPPDDSESPLSSPTDENVIHFDIVIPTPGLTDSDATDFPFEIEITPPGAPHLHNIDRFRSDPLYGQ